MVYDVLDLLVRIKLDCRSPRKTGIIIFQSTIFGINDDLHTCTVESIHWIHSQKLVLDSLGEKRRFNRSHTNSNARPMVCYNRVQDLLTSSSTPDETRPPPWPKAMPSLSCIQPPVSHSLSIAFSSFMGGVKNKGAALSFELLILDKYVCIDLPVMKNINLKGTLIIRFFSNENCGKWHMS